NLSVTRLPFYTRFAKQKLPQHELPLLLRGVHFGGAVLCQLDPVDELSKPLCSKLVAGDRKSTRLNSSHEWISYAVFGLKKKSKLGPALCRWTVSLSRAGLALMAEHPHMRT